MSTRAEQIAKASAAVEGALDKMIISYPRTSCVLFGVLGVAVGWYVF